MAHLHSYFYFLKRTGCPLTPWQLLSLTGTVDQRLHAKHISYSWNGNLSFREKNQGLDLSKVKGAKKQITESSPFSVLSQSPKGSFLLYALWASESPRSFGPSPHDGMSYESFLFRPGVDAQFLSSLCPNLGSYSLLRPPNRF